MAEPGDMILLRNYEQQSSEAAFATLVQRHINLVYSTALRHVGIAAHAEEITQVVFVILARQAASLRPDTILEAWLHETTRLTALRFGRGERRRQFREQEAYMQSTLPESNDDATWNQLSPLLDEAISRLGKKDRDAVMLRFFKGQSMREVAAALSVNEDAAQKRVRRAVEKLRRFFSRGGIVLPAAVLTAAISGNSVQAAPAALVKTVTTIAFAKGAAAGGSTLTLIHGVLRIMAWAKMKTTIIAGAVILLGIGAGVVAVEAVDGVRGAAAPDIQGAWEGVCNLAGIAGVNKGESAHTRVVLKIHKTNGVYSATADEIDLALKDIPVAKVIYNFPNIRLDLGWTVFEATLNAETTEMTFSGAPTAVWARTNTPDTVPEWLTESDFAGRAGSDLQGCWAGNFDKDGQPVYWKIAEPTNGIFRGEVDNPTFGESHKPFSVIYHRPSVTFTVLYGTGIFKGELNGAGTEITGTWLQLGKEKPITLTRTDYHPEPAHPENEYKFTSKTDLQGHWKTDLDLRIAKQILDMGDMKSFPVVLDIAQLPDGTFSATVALPLMTYMGLGDPMPASAVQYQPPNLRLEWKPLNAVFAARLENGRLTGNFRLGDSSTPLTFERRH